MHPKAKQLLGILEQLADKDLSKTANFRMIFALRTKLKDAMPEAIVEELVLKMKIDLDDDLVDDEFIDTAAILLTSMIVRIRHALSAQGFNNLDQLMLTIAPQLSINIG